MSDERKKLERAHEAAKTLHRETHRKSEAFKEQKREEAAQAWRDSEHPAAIERARVGLAQAKDDLKSFDYANSKRLHAAIDGRKCWGYLFRSAGWSERYFNLARGVIEIAGPDSKYAANKSWRFPAHGAVLFRPLKKNGEPALKYTVIVVEEIGENEITLKPEHDFLEGKLYLGEPDANQSETKAVTNKR